MRELSILIPARNEMFLKNTIEDILKNIEADTEIIVVLDGAWANPPLAVNERVTIIYHNKSIGQRAATNEAARLSTAKYIMKADAHCSFDKGFDRKLIANCEHDWTVVPAQYNLHVFNWLCKKCNHETYQGPTPTKCEKCDNTSEFERKIIWRPRLSRRTEFWRFDKELKFNYWGEFKRRPEAQQMIAPTMSCLGACWFLERSRYWEIDGLDESHGSWGQMGTELACKSWLSGGKLMVNKNTWFAHMFRTQGGDFGFPYEIHGSTQERTREYSRDLWYNNKWPKQKYPLSWLIDKFKPVPEWHDPIGKQVLDMVVEKGESFRKTTPSTPIVEVQPEKKVEAPPSPNPVPLPLLIKPTAGIICMTDNRLDPRLFKACQKQLIKAANGKRVINVSLSPVEFGENIVLPLQRGLLTLFKQVLVGLLALDTKYIFAADHDILYHPSHFDFVPPRDDVYYYDLNVWRIRMEDGHALHYDAKQHHQLCCSRDLLIDHYIKRIRIVENLGRWDRRIGFEPGSHHRKERVDNFGSATWWCEQPSLDLRHKGNATASRWRQDQFRNKRACTNWQEAEEVPYWGRTKGNINNIIDKIINEP